LVTATVDKTEFDALDALIARAKPTNDETNGLLARMRASVQLTNARRNIQTKYLADLRASPAVCACVYGAVCSLASMFVFVCLHGCVFACLCVCMVVCLHGCVFECLCACARVLRCLPDVSTRRCVCLYVLGVRVCVCASLHLCVWFKCLTSSSPI
jgi:hypothetical protein